MSILINMKWITVILLLLVLTNNSKAQTNFIWGKQFGTDKEEASTTAITDQFGNIYMAGSTNGILASQSFGNGDAFVTKIDSSGNTIWTKLFGSEEEERLTNFTIDKNGNIYASGYTKGVIGEKHFGREDVFVVKLDTSGNIEWKKQYGTDSTEVGNAIYVDWQGDIYVTGLTKGLLGKSSFGETDAFILKLDKMGNKLFVTQFGTPGDDQCQGITADIASDIYVCGATSGDLGAKNKGKTDAFVGKFNNKGEQIKIIQFGTDNYDMLTKIKVDKLKNIYAGGSTGGDLAAKNQGQGDAFFTKIDVKGDILWTKQFGTPKWDGINGMDLKEAVTDNIIISGCQNWPSCQSYIRMYKTDGTLLWVKQFVAEGKGGGTCGTGIWLDSKGNIYHTGNTGGNLFGANQGAHDVYIIKQALDKGTW